MKNSRKVCVFLVSIVVLFFYIQNVQPAFSQEVDTRLYAELSKLRTDGKIVTVYKVPCVKIKLEAGESINSLCRKIDYFKNDHYFFRQRISLINRVEPMAKWGGKDSLSLDVSHIFIPVNFSIRPEILPEFKPDIAQHKKFILADVGIEYLGLYENGRLVEIFPICSGAKGTPTRNFRVMSKEKDHYSKKYANAWMPWSLRLFGGYFMHGGILVGRPASHGCLRLVYEDSIVVYNWTEVGIPGAVIRTAG